MVDSWGGVAALVGALVAVAHLAVCFLALCVLPGHRKPSTALAWLILILAVPGFGVIVFLLFGSTSVGRKRRAWQHEVNELVMADAPDAAPAGAAAEERVSASVRGFARLNRNLGSLPLSGGNTVEVVTDYAGSVAAMVAEVERAQSYVHVQFYISAWDHVTAPFFEALVAATERGVDVRLLFDHLGSRGIPGHKEFVQRLEGTRITWARMLPISVLKGELRRPDLRNHRKILVVDGQVAFTGSQNLIEPGYDKPKNHKLGREWVELMVRVTGPVVQQLGVVFATDWFAETRENLRELVARAPEPVTDIGGGGGATEVRDTSCQVVPSGPGFVTENNLRLFNSMLYSAHHRVSLTSPYFVPDESLLYAVTTAAQRGVDVELFVSATADQFMVFHAQRSYYEALLTAGVRIWLYPEPNVLHAKFFTIDDDVAVIGSSNMDYRSFALNYEVVVMCEGRGVVERLEAVQDEYRSLSSELTLDAWRQRSRRSTYVDNVMRLTAALQ